MTRALLIVGALAATACSPALQGQAGIPGQTAAERDIQQIEEQFRVAKVSNDVDVLAEVLHEAFVETTQNGNSRDKAGIIELFRTFPIAALTTDSAAIRVTDGIAVVNGVQTETNGSGIDRMLFTRVYVQDSGTWRLLSSAQFRDPRTTLVIR